MLVLTRKLGEEIIVGGVTSIKILSIHGKQVKLGIDGPKEVSVVRKEIIDGSR